MTDMKGVNNWETNSAAGAGKVRKKAKHFRPLALMNYGLRSLKGHGWLPCSEKACLGEWEKCPHKKPNYACLIAERLMEAYIREQAEARYHSHGLTPADRGDLQREAGLQCLRYLKTDGSEWSLQQYRDAIRLQQQIVERRLARWAVGGGHGLELPGASS